MLFVLYFIFGNFPMSIEGTLFKFGMIPVCRITLFTYIGILRYNYNLSPKSIKTMKERFIRTYVVEVQKSIGPFNLFVVQILLLNFGFPIGSNCGPLIQYFVTSLCIQVLVCLLAFCVCVWLLDLLQKDFLYPAHPI